MRHIVVALLLSSLGLRAATLNSNGSASDTQTQINAASSGDTVLLPASGSYTWSADVTIPDTKAITVDLNGRTITLDGAGNEFTVNSPTSGSAPNRVTNGAIVRGNGFHQFSGPFNILDTRTGAGVRVDHITFTGDDVLIDINGQGKGVMDNCVFPDLEWAQEFIHINGWGAEDDTGWGIDSGATLAGSANIFYIEDCTFTQPNSTSGVAWIQAYNGSRQAIRYCSFDFVSVDMHGTAGQVGARWWECYENTFTNDTPSGQPTWAFSFRAGSGVIFNNVMAPGAGHDVNTGLCEEDSGYPALYQIGRGLDQALDPAYVWDNGAIDLSLDSCDAPETSGMVQLDRDVYASARPDYSPYTYPHPLRGGGGSATIQTLNVQNLNITGP